MESRVARLAELERAIAEERAAIAHAREGHLRGLWDELGAKLDASGSSLDELHRLVGFVGAKAARNIRGKAAVPAKKVPNKTGRKIAPAYINPNDPSQTWSGRGMTARWLKEALAADPSKTISDFAIAAVGAARKTKRARASA